MRRLALIGVAGLVLAGCQPRVPASNPGNALDAPPGAVMPMATAPTASLAAPGAISTGAIGATDLAAAGIGAAPAGVVPAAPAMAPMAPAALPAAMTGAAPAAIPGAVAADAPLAIQSSGISDEQDFAAVAGRETIESDAARLAQAAAAYQVVQPTALPTAPQDTGPNIVEYALNAPNRVGQPWFSRFIWSGQGRFERNCASYRSPDEAQRDFLSRGGPDRDPRGIDPDGDGFACGWDPAPFLAAVGRN